MKGSRRLSAIERQVRALVDPPASREEREEAARERRTEARQANEWAAFVELAETLPTVHQQGLIEYCHDEARWGRNQCTYAAYADGYGRAWSELWVEASWRVDGTSNPRPALEVVEAGLRDARLWSYRLRLRDAQDELQRAGILAEWEREHEPYDGPFSYWEHWEGGEYRTRERWIREHGIPREY